ncbi:MAG: amidohydrolase, partial [Anaerolineales bacterium]|nr:amidohydrolase [Anaerolineales bacterium]
ANSAALALVGFDKTTANPDGGVIAKDPVTGELTGLLEETARLPVLEMAMDISPLQFLQMVEQASDFYVAHGVTTAQSGGVDKTMLQGMWLAQKLGITPLRLELWPHYDSLGKALLDGTVDAADYNSPTLHLGAVKITADGSIQGYTGYLTVPYHLPFHGDKRYRGYPTISRHELTEIVTRFHRAGFQLAIHGNGDASIDDIIHAFSEAQRVSPKADPRLILVHAQMAREDQLASMHTLGITPSFFSVHTFYWGDRHRDIFMGPERAGNMSPARSALDEGLRISVHLDTPVVPMEPLMAAWSTVNRLTSSGKRIGPHQRISAMEALRAITIDAAWQIFREDEVGSIEPGKLADLVVLDGDPLESPDTIRNIKVQKTLIGGVTVFHKRAG